ncbi:MAG: hypothetical protein LBQ66_00770 [Planctomycetaceae bacterium]|nr:hypothetical protein [Planctomycetaceae bacterium]
MRIRDKRNVQGKRKESGKKEKNIIMDWNAGIPPAFQSVAATRQTYVVQQGGKPPSLNSLPKFKL